MVIVNLKSLKQMPKNTYVFSSSTLNVKNCNYRDYHEKILEGIKSGRFNAVITGLDINKLKAYAITENFYQKIYSPVWKSKNSLVFCVNDVDLDTHRDLYRLFVNQDMSKTDLISAVIAIECILPLVTDDDRHWHLQQKLQNVFRKRHGKGHLVMYTSKDFCNLFKM